MHRTKPLTRTVASISALGLLLAAGLLHAGPLTPPAGPVASSYKTLTDVEPRTAINVTNTPGDADSLFKITQPGSYYLTGNISGVVGRHGIEIAASGVTLDLAGFEILGVPAGGPFDGITVSSPLYKAITIQNGSVRNWGGDGIDLGFYAVPGCIVRGIRASDNIGSGISMGTSGVVNDCTAYRNTGDGFTLAFSCTISNSTALSNSLKGINATAGCTISGCTVALNTGNGISTLSVASIIGCTAHLNQGSGIDAGTASTVTGCASYSNSGNGIIANGSCTIADCSSRLNTLDGIRFSASCLIRGNTSAGNGNNGDGAGIHATGGDNRIEANNCSGSDRGIDVDAAGNFIVRNSCSGNALNWAIAANNYYGPIIDRTGVATAAVSGSAAAGTLASTDSNANFSF